LTGSAGSAFFRCPLNLFRVLSGVKNMNAAATERHTVEPPSESILRAALALKPEIEARRAAIESERRLPAELVDRLKRAGVFRMTMPRDWGGDELDPLSQLEIIKALSAADVSVVWRVMIGCHGGVFTGSFV
jgi:alkylation response protein AidB-like acyl-CoA dehydrogenase